MKNKLSRNKSQGFTLVELLVVVLIIGILAAIAVPQYFKVIEKSRAAEAPATFDAIRGSEERYLAQNGIYYTGPMTSTCGMDICPGGNYPNLSNFNDANIGALSIIADPANAQGWALTLVRNTNAAGYGQYNATYNTAPGVSPHLTITNCSDAYCCADLGFSQAQTNGACY